MLSPKLAVVWAAFFNFVAAFFLGTAVAKTIGKGMIQLDIVTQYVVIAGLLGAIVWDLLTWWWGLPTSSSHALIGGYAGAAMAHAHSARLGRSHVIIAERLDKTLIFIVRRSPHGPCPRLRLDGRDLLDLSATSLHSAVDKLFRKLQLLSAAAYSLGHGGNDAQKTMGIVAGALYSAKYMSDSMTWPPTGDTGTGPSSSPRTRHRSGNLFRRLANRSHHGFAHHQTEAGGRILRRNCRSHHAVRDRAGWNSR